MRKREAIQYTHEQLLDTTSVAEAESVMEEHYDRLGLHQDASNSVRKEYELSRAASQPVNSALGELAWRRVVEEMSVRYMQTNSLELYDKVSHEKYKMYSPILRRFIGTMHAWLRPALQEVLDEANAGRMPHAAIYDAFIPVRARRRKASEWQKEKALAAGEPWTEAPEDAGEFFMFSWGEFNLPAVAAGVLGRAIAVNKDRKMDAEGLTARLQADLDLGSDLSSAVNSISIPILSSSSPLLEQYSLWERGKLSIEGLLAFCQTNPFFTSGEVHSTLKNGPIKNPGHCAADIRVGKPERFPVHPQDFLKQLGVEDPGEITFTKLYVASANVTARDTILTVLPR